MLEFSECQHLVCKNVSIISTKSIRKQFLHKRVLRGFCWNENFKTFFRGKLTGGWGCGSQNGYLKFKILINTLNICKQCFTIDHHHMHVIDMICYVFQIFHDWIYKDREEMQGNDFGGFIQGKAIDIMIRRNFIYEDAYDKLRPENGKFLWLIAAYNLFIFIMKGIIVM